MSVPCMVEGHVRFWTDSGICEACEWKKQEVRLRAEGAAQEREAIRAETARLHDLSSYGLREVLEDLLAFIRARGEAPAYCAVHQHAKWCQHNGGVVGPTGYEAPKCAAWCVAESCAGWPACREEPCATCGGGRVLPRGATAGLVSPCPDCAPKPEAPCDHTHLNPAQRTMTCAVCGYVFPSPWASPKTDAHEPERFTPEHYDWSVARSRAAVLERLTALESARELALKALRLAPDVRCAYCMGPGGGDAQDSCPESPTCQEYVNEEHGDVLASAEAIRAEVRALTTLLEATYLPLSIRELRRTQGTAAAAKQWEEQSHAYLAGLQKQRDEALAEVARLREKVDHWNRVTLTAITQAKAEAARAERERCAKLLQGTLEDPVVGGAKLSADYREAFEDAIAVFRALPDEG